MNRNQTYAPKREDTTPHCDWCGKRAVTRTYRTLYEDTEFEQTSSFFECAACAVKPTSELTFCEDEAVEGEDHG